MSKAADEMTQEVTEITIDGEKRHFDISDPVLPKWIEDKAFVSGNFPYQDKLKRKHYEEELQLLQIELVKLQQWQKGSGEKIICLFEGRDAAGKGGTIQAIRENMQPRRARIIALPKPNDREQGEWYYQRYIRHFPTAGEITLFDRSWYNRAGVETVMGFCSEQETKRFLDETPLFEEGIVRSGIRLYKFWLNVGQEMQLKRFHDRRHSPLKYWKLSPFDILAMSKWDAYSTARDDMLKATHTKACPWRIVKSNDKRRARVNVIKSILREIDYQGKDEKLVSNLDENIISQDPLFATD